MTVVVVLIVALLLVGGLHLLLSSTIDKTRDEETARILAEQEGE